MHNILSTNGRSNIAYTGKTPWHSLGQKLESSFDADTALKEANLDWEVEVAPLYHRAPGNPDALIKSSKGKIVRRVDTGTELGVVGPKYSALQNRDAFGFFDGVFGEGKARFDTAGCLGIGEKIWLLAKLEDNEPIEILPDDVLDKYLLLTNSHDGSYAVMSTFTSIRVVCQNTLGMVTRDVFGRKKNGEVTDSIRIKHVGNVADRLEFAGNVLRQAGVFYDELKTVFQAFAGKQLSGEQTRNYIHNSLFWDDLKTKRRDEQVDIVEGLMHTGRGHDIKGVRGTLWGAYNAVTEFVDHHKEYRGGDAKRLEASQFGTGQNIKRRAIKAGAKLVGIGKDALALN